MLPLKIRILEYIIEKSAPVTTDELMKALKAEYGGERQFTKKRVESYLGQLLGVGFLEAESMKMGKNNELEIAYKITDYGLSRERFIPGHEKEK